MEVIYPPRGVVTDAQLPNEYGISRVTAWRLEKSDPKFPRRIKIIGNKNGRFRHELDAYFDARPRVSGGAL